MKKAKHSTTHAPMVILALWGIVATAALFVAMMGCCLPHETKMDHSRMVELRR